MNFVLIFTYGKEHYYYQTENVNTNLDVAYPCRSL